MVSREQGMIAPELAEKYGRSLATVRRWMTSDVWPTHSGKRGRWLEFDPAVVDEVYREHFGREVTSKGDPDELLTQSQIAEHTGLAPGTVRADISRGRLGEPDEDENGVKRWKRSTIDGTMAGRRTYHRNK